MIQNFPHVDIPVELIAWKDVTEDILNIYTQPCRLQACIFALCTEGTLNASINLMEYEIKKNDMIVLLPGTIIQFRGESRKVRICFSGFSAHCVNGVNLIQATMGTYSKIWENPIATVNDDVAAYITDYFALLARLSTTRTINTTMARSILNTIIIGINEIYTSRPHSQTVMSRKEEICRQFVQLVIENYTNERRAQFYADKMGISLQHLSSTIKQMTEKNVLDMIAHVVIIDIKAKLKSSNMTIQEIAYSLNFPNATFFGKYFKRHMGMSPLQYRNS